MKDKNVLIVGGGPEGIRAALEKAETGVQVTILEKFPTLGGERIPRDRLIKPDEAFVNPDLDKVRNHSNIRILTYSDLKSVTRDNGSVQTRILKRSLLVDNSKCNDCKACIKVCPVNMFDPTWMLYGAPFFAPSHVIFWGFMVLIGTPLLRITLSVGVYAKMKDWEFTAITGAVLVILLVSMILGVG